MVLRIILWELCLKNFECLSSIRVEIISININLLIKLNEAHSSNSCLQCLGVEASNSSKTCSSCSAISLELTHDCISLLLSLSSSYVNFSIFALIWDSAFIFRWWGCHWCFRSYLLNNRLSFRLLGCCAFLMKRYKFVNVFNIISCMQFLYSS